jgi:hypothetical protein
MFRTPRTPLLIATALLICACAHAADEPALDATKYPQDTPQNAVASLIKALDSKDYGYYLAWLLTPGDKERILKKYGTVAKYVEAKSDAEQSAAMKKMADTLRVIEKEGKQTTGETGGAKWTQFSAGKERLHLDLKDGRWLMNLKPSEAGEKK